MTFHERSTKQTFWRAARAHLGSLAPIRNFRDGFVLVAYFLFFFPWSWSNSVNDQITRKPRICHFPDFTGWPVPTASSPLLGCRPVLASRPLLASSPYRPLSGIWERTDSGVAVELGPGHKNLIMTQKKLVFRFFFNKWNNNCAWIKSK